MDERMRFVARILEGEKMAELCREFGVSMFASSKHDDAEAPIKPVGGLSAVGCERSNIHGAILEAVCCSDPYPAIPFDGGKRPIYRLSEIHVIIPDPGARNSKSAIGA